MTKAKVFISYSSEDRHSAGKLKGFLEKWGVEAFLAHEDITASTRWRSEILKALRSSDVFLALLTKNFAKSEWTAQEAGGAVVLKKVIIPVSADISPYGFLRDFQAVKCSVRPTERDAWKIFRSLARRNRIRELVVGGYLEFLSRSSSFDEALDAFDRLEDLGSLSNEQVSDLVVRSARNQNIFGCFKLQPSISRLIRNSEVPKHVANRFFAKVKHWNA